MSSKYGGLSADAHDYFCQIGLSVTQAKLDSLEGENRALGRIMLEHPEYHHLWGKHYAVVEMDMERLVTSAKVSPHIHLAIEATVINQIEKNKLPQLAKAYEALKEAGVEAREARKSARSAEAHGRREKFLRLRSRNEHLCW